MKTRLSVLSAVAVLALGLIAFKKWGPALPVAETPASRDVLSLPPGANLQQIVAALKSNSKADVYSQLPENGQSVLVHLVVRHCSEKYHADSCIQYVNSCGRPCLAHITTEERQRMLKDYLAIRKKMGLGAL